MQLKQDNTMELKILDDKDNKMFNRREIKASTMLEKTPGREEVLKVLSEKFKTPEENIKIKGIHGRFGVKEFTIEANIYTSKKEKDILELKKKKEAEAEKRIEETKKAVETPKEEVKETPQEQAQPEQTNKTPVEEKKEEVKE